MKLSIKKFLTATVIAIFLGATLVFLPEIVFPFTTPKDFFDVKKMGDMSDFDPNKPVMPTGDTIKIAIVASFSGPAATV